MASNPKKRSRPIRFLDPETSASSPPAENPTPILEDLEEFPALGDIVPAKRKLSPAACWQKVAEKEVVAEDGVCVDGTTYYIPATAALCGIPEAISPTVLVRASMEKETPPQRQFPGKAYSLYEENLEYPTLSLPKNLRQAIYDHLEVYRRYLFSPDMDDWIVCDNFQIYGKMEEQCGLVQGNKEEVYISRHTETGDFVVIRRLMNFVLRNHRAVSIVSKWRSVNHPNVVRIRSVTTTRAFDDSSVLFAYDFYPNAITLDTFIKNEGNLLKEESIWSFIIQLVSGLHAIHNAGLAARVLGERFVLITGLDSCTIKINCVAMADVIDIADLPQSNFMKCFVGEHRAKPEDQQADFIELGSLVEYMIRNCSGDASKDLTDFGKALADGEITSMDRVLASLGTRVLDHMALVMKQNEILETELSKEVENGRLFRLLYGLLERIKGYESSEHPRSIENRHLLNMFKDHLMSQDNVYEVISSLNKLDRGVGERIRLVSPTEDIINYVSYEELRRVMEGDQPMIPPFSSHFNVLNDSGLMG